MNGPGNAGEHPGRRRRAENTSRRRRIGRGDVHGHPAAPAHEDPATPVHRDPALSVGDDASAATAPGAPAPRHTGTDSGDLDGESTGRQGPTETAAGPPSVMHGVIAYFRGNPQAFVLLVVCLVLGLGTFLAVVIALLTSGSIQTTGEPSGVLFGAQDLLGRFNLLF